MGNDGRIVTLEELDRIEATAPALVARPSSQERQLFNRIPNKADDLATLLGKFGLGLIDGEEFRRRMELGGWTDADIDAYCAGVNSVPLAEPHIRDS